jgi:hypothetical protein
MREQARGLGVELGDRSVKESVKFFAEFIFKSVPEADLGYCEHCGGASASEIANVEVAACPFCNDGAGAAAQEPASEIEEPEASADLEDKLAAAVKAGDREDAKARKAAELAERKRAAAEARAAKKAPKAPKGESGTVAANGLNGAASHALAKSSAASIVRADAARLDEAVAEVHALKGDFHASGWKLGCAIADLLRTNLWKARMTSDGKVAYDNFNTFCETELGIGRAQARRLSDAATRFDERTFREIGARKLSIVLSVPESAQPKLLERVKTGATKAQIEAAARKAREEYAEESGEEYQAPAAGPRSAADHAHKTPKKAKAAADAPERSEVTVAVVANKNLAASLFVEHGKGKPATPAKLADLKKGLAIAGAIDLTNRVRAHLSLKEAKDGQLVVVMKVKRVEKGA